MKNQIFISYRRKGGDVVAKLICEALKNKGYSVFYDYDSLKGGVFDSRIIEAIDECRDFVLVLPKKALARCKKEGDWVRREIRHALMTNKNIIPVMVDGFDFPKKMPDDIKEVARYNGVRFRMDFFESVVDKIVERLSIDNVPLYANATSSVREDVQKAVITDNVKYRLYLYLSTGMTSDLVLYSPESSSGNILKCDFSEENWTCFSNAVKKVVSVLVNAKEDRVSLNRKSPIGLKSCAPCGSLHFEDQYRIKFDVNYLSDVSPKNYESLHLTLENNTVSINLFDKGDYVFKYVSPQTPLSHFGIDEKELILALQPLVSFAEHSTNAVCGDAFESKVHSDNSGGYHLKYMAVN